MCVNYDMENSIQHYRLKTPKNWRYIADITYLYKVLSGFLTVSISSQINFLLNLKINQNSFQSSDVLIYPVNQKDKERRLSFFQSLF